ncbi:MAG: multiheme c-type cytochrome [Vicinamibacterales bacterium]
MSPVPGSPASTNGHPLAVTPTVRSRLSILLGGLALLAANSVYLGSITFLEWSSGRAIQGYVYLWMFLAHVALGIATVVPFVGFVVPHLRASYRRRNRRAVAVGYALLGVSLLVIASGVLLLRVAGIDLKSPAMRGAVYWAHVATPVAAAWLYVLHRLAGPRLRWRAGVVWAVVTAVTVLLLAAVDRLDRVRQTQSVPTAPLEAVEDLAEAGTPRATASSADFSPSLVRTASGRRIPAEALMTDDYCRACHEDVYHGWARSAHRFSSGNNAPYAASVRETRERVLARDGTVTASRWCAGCHDVVPLLTGAFDRPDFDLERDPLGQAGLTCSVCHAITAIGSPRGNADFTIAEPTQYPFAFSRSPWLRALSRQMVRAKPSFHKQTFLKPLHRTAEFCSACHKVHLPGQLTHYKDFLRGQNHYDSYLLSGVSGHGARAFYYPERSVTTCAGCHMPTRPSNDFGATPDAAGVLSVHDHLFPAANTGLAHLRGDADTVAEHQGFLKDRVRVDIFGLRVGGRVDGALVAPLRPTVPAVRPGGRYLLETVIRTLRVGHQLTQGTADSNELWMNISVTSGGRLIGRSGDIREDGSVNPWSHFVNIFMLDREGRRIDRRNAQDIFVPLYDHQVPPGAAQVVHYDLVVPTDVRDPVVIDVKLEYRKFDRTYMRFVKGDAYRIDLPVTTLAHDTVTLPVVEARADEAASGVPPAWERWNDYGIGLLLEGATSGDRGELRQAADAFREVERLGRADGPLNLARVFLRDGQIDAAAEALTRASAAKASWWLLAWLGGQVAREQGDLPWAIDQYRTILTAHTPEMGTRGLDFSLDYEVWNALGLALTERAAQLRGATPEEREARTRTLQEAADAFERTLTIDPENVTAHYTVAQVYRSLGDEARAATHRTLHLRYKPDENARDRAVAIARRASAAADHASQPVVIYPLHPPSSP